MEKKFVIELNERDLKNIYDVFIKHCEYEAMRKITNSILIIKEEVK